MVLPDPRQTVSLIGINTMTLSGRIRETFRTTWKVYHDSSDHNRSVFHRGVVGELRIHDIYEARVLIPVADLQKQKSTVIQKSTKKCSDAFKAL